MNWKTKILLLLIFPIVCFVDMYNGYVQMILNKETILPHIFKIIIIIITIKYSYKFKLTWIICFVFLIIYIRLIIQYPNIDYVFELQYFAKLIYPYFILSYILSLKNSISQKTLFKFILSYGLIAAIVIILTYILNTGISSTGGDYGFGIKGFFKAGNDIGLTLLLCNCIACYLFFSDNKFIILIAIIGVGSCLIGSMAGILGTLLIVLSIIICIVLYKKTYKVNIYIYMTIILFIPIIISSFNYISNYDDYMLMKVDAFKNGKSRYSLIILGDEVLKESTDNELLFGRGWTVFSDQLQNKSPGVKSVEVDIYDLVGTYGIFFSLIFFIYPLAIIFKSFKMYFREKFLLSYWIIIASLLFCGHSFLAGHAITSVQSLTIYVSFSSLILLSNKNASKKTKKNIIGK